MSDKDTITFKCGNCGSKDFVLPPERRPDDQVTCAGCRATWRFDEFTAQGYQAAGKTVESLITERLKGLKGWFFKKEGE